jgi:Putative DNA-binding domain
VPENSPEGPLKPERDHAGAGSAVDLAHSLGVAPPLLPDDLSATTFDDIVGLVDRLEYEPGPVDFKAALNLKGPNAEEMRNNFRRTAASMANTEGGWILFGVLDRRSVAASAGERIVGIPLGGDLRKELGEKLEPIAPHIRFDVATA